TSPKDFPWIDESALKDRQKRFVLDGEAMILGVDGISDFNARHSTTKFSSSPWMCWRWIATICATCRCQCAKPPWRDCFEGDRTACSSATSNRARLAPTCSE